MKLIGTKAQNSLIYISLTSFNAKKLKGMSTIILQGIIMGTIWHLSKILFIGSLNTFRQFFKLLSRYFLFLCKAKFGHFFKPDIIIDWMLQNRILELSTLVNAHSLDSKILKFIKISLDEWWSDWNRNLKQTSEVFQFLRNVYITTHIILTFFSRDTLLAKLSTLCWFSLSSISSVLAMPF